MYYVFTGWTGKILSLYFGVAEDYFCNATPCRWQGCSWRFEITWFLHLYLGSLEAGRWLFYVSLTRRKPLPQTEHSCTSYTSWSCFYVIKRCCVLTRRNGNIVWFCIYFKIKLSAVMKVLFHKSAPSCVISHTIPAGVLKTFLYSWLLIKLWY